LSGRIFSGEPVPTPIKSEARFAENALEICDQFRSANAEKG
jgi:hypothetical protein